MADPASYRPAPGEIPASPGVYRFLDASGRVIYVGKAISLRSRLNSYFADPATLHFRTRVMVFSADKVEWTVVRNELEALQLEYTWIKQYDPRFNVKYRDDKSYPWLCVTWSEEYPRVFVGRGSKRKGWRYFGPYGQAWAIRDSVDALLTVFPMRSCSGGVFRSAQASGRPCLMGYIGKCAAPCVGRIDAVQHRRLADDFCAVMAGRISGYIKTYQTEMAEAAAELEYERAAQARDYIRALELVAERNAVVLADGTDADVIALAAEELEVAFQLFQVRDGRLVAERGWVADRVDDTDQAGLIEAFLLQLYAEQPLTELSERRRAIPAEILVPELPPSHAELAELLAEERQGKVDIRVAQRGAKADLCQTAARNAQETLALHKTRRASDLTTRNQALEEIQQALGLAVVPLRIECYDISHLMGTDVVASMVVFEDGLARKNQYRHFLVRSVASNDVGAMREVLSRRFARLREEQALLAAGDQAGLVDATTRAAKRFSYPPQLIVVDGGAPQVAAAQAVLDELGITDIALCGLAKRLEEVWLPGEEYPVILPRASEAMYLLQRLRDEAHRFAITYHRQRRGQSMVESQLDDVPGLGEIRRQALLRHFGSRRQLLQATAAEIAQVPGFGPKLAEAVVAALAGQQPGQAINTATGEVSEV